MSAAEKARRAGALGEAALVYAGMMLAFRPLALAVGGGAAASAITQLTVFTLGSVSWILLLRRDPAGFGLRFETPGESFRLAFRAYSIVGPGCIYSQFNGPPPVRFDHKPFFFKSSLQIPG